jgi:hypothetical protein
LDEAEEYFRGLRIQAEKFHFKVMESDYDHCFMLLKWASTCNAELKNIEPVISDFQAKFRFTFAFTSISTLSEFVEHLDTNVNGI